MHKQTGFARTHLIIGLVVAIVTVLGFASWRILTQEETAKNSGNLKGGYVHLQDWKIRFPSDTNYDLIKDPASRDSEKITSAYAITTEELAKDCSSPAYLGFITRYEQPDRAIGYSPADTTPNDLYGEIGTLIDDELYVVRGPQLECSRTDNAVNRQFNEAATKLENELKGLESY